jgi:hypothetical protein
MNQFTGAICSGVGRHGSGRGDLEGLLAAFHPEGVFTLVGDAKSLQVTGSVQGHRNLRETFGGFIATFKFVDRKILSEVVEADRAAVHSA